MNIFVAKLDYGVKSHELEDLFTPYGTVESAKVINDRETGRSKGFGFVEMPNDEEGAKAIEALDGTSVRGRNIVVKKAEARR